MSDPVWLDKSDCLGFRDQLQARFGGLAETRDEGLPESALSRPLQLFQNGEPTLFDLAAACAHGIAKNHPFLDGNKRAGLMAAALFLEINGMVFEATEEEAVLHTLALAADGIGADEYAAWLAASCSPR